jgi:hypothetical protein
MPVLEPFSVNIVAVDEGVAWQKKGFSVTSMRKEPTMRHVRVFSAVLILLATSLFVLVYAADTDDELELLRAEIRLDKEQIISEGMQFNDTEAKRF